mgnify:CR=1 FL=1
MSSTTHEKNERSNRKIRLSRRGQGESQARAPGRTPCTGSGPHAMHGLRAAHHARAPGRTPCTSSGPHAMHDPNKRTRARRPGTVSAGLSDNENGLPSPCKDLHMSRLTKPFCNGLAVSSHSSCKNRRRECRLPAKKREGAPEGAVFCALRNLVLPPEFLNRSTKCAAFDADLKYPAPAPCRSGGGSEGGETPPPIPTITQADGAEIRQLRGCRRRDCCRLRVRW